MKTIYKGVEYNICKNEIERGVEKILTEDAEFSCNESSKNFMMKSGMYKELAQMYIIMLGTGDKTRYHKETLITQAFSHHIASKRYEATAKHLILRGH